jgi:hypothetical protein
MRVGMMSRIGVRRMRAMSVGVVVLVPVAFHVFTPDSPSDECIEWSPRRSVHAHPDGDVRNLSVGNLAL